MQVAHFDSDLDFRDLNHESKVDKIRLMLLAPLVFYSAILGLTITVPARFVTDLASVPRFLWWIVPPIGRYDAAAVVHDWLCQSGGFTRKQVDDVLLEAMIAYTVAEPTRLLIYNSVRVGGWVSWNRYRKMEAIEVAAKAT